MSAAKDSAKDSAEDAAKDGDKGAAQDGEAEKHAAVGESRAAAEQGAPAKTVIVGSAGRMGEMLLRRSMEAGLDCSGLERPYDAAACKAAFRDADLALFCVPAAALASAIGELRKYFPAGMILADITSVKEAPLQSMLRLWPGAVVGTHPLFGPLAAQDGDLPVAVVAGRGGEPALKKTENFFRRLNCRVFRCSAQEHDKAMAKIQNMNFITNLAYFALLAEEDDLLPFLTPSFLRRKDAAAKMLTEDAAMFSGLFEANPHSQDAVRRFGKMLNVAAAGDINLLCNRARWWWKDTEK